MLAQRPPASIPLFSRQFFSKTGTAIWGNFAWPPPPATLPLAPFRAGSMRRIVEKRGVIRRLAVYEGRNFG
jgi:hypothetical protein